MSVSRLAYFERQYSFLTQHQLISEVRMHYVGQLVKNICVVVLGLEVICSHFEHLRELKQDLNYFYEPFKV
jgi:hypothetical protein